MRWHLLAAGLLALVATEAAAQDHHGGQAARRVLDRCQADAARLRGFELRARRDGVSRDEARIAASLRADLAHTCGNSRRAPRRARFHR